MAAHALTIGLRVVLALEFAAAIGTWAIGLCPWPIAGAIATCALTEFLFTWDEPTTGEQAPASRPQCAEPMPYACRLLGCTHAGDPLWGRCDRCGRRP